MSVSIIVILVLLIPLVSGVLLIIFSRRGGMGYPGCGKCGYDVGGSVGTVTRCPECGSPFMEVGILPPRGKRNSIMLASGIVIIVFVVGCIGTGLVTTRSSTALQQARAAAVQAKAAAQRQAQQATQAATQQSPATSIENESSASQSPPQEEDSD